MPPGILHSACIGLILAVGQAAAFAQDLPSDHGGAASPPLFVQDLPVGTISVRITRPSMNQPLVGTDVSGTWTSANGKPASATVKTGADGRAIFTEVPAGATFSAKAEVEGQTLTTARFTVPDEGGTRLLLIVGDGAAGAMTDMTSRPGHGLAAVTEPLLMRVGKVEPRDGLPAGTVEIRVLGRDGKPLTGARVDLLLAQHAAGSPPKHASTDDSGTVRFSGLATKAPAAGHLVALVEHDGLRIGSQPFDLEAKRGSAGELRVPEKTSELSVLRVSANSRMMVELREDSLAFMQNLVVENHSDKVFDPGPRGVLFPLPDGCTGAETLAGGAEVEMKEGAGAIWRGPLPPTDTPLSAAQVRVGCVLATHEMPELEIVQPMPLGLQGGLAMIQAIHAVGLSAPGLRARPVERDDNGNELRSYELGSLEPGQPLHLTVYGLPTRGRSGRRIALGLVLLLVVAGIAAVRKPRRPAASGNG